MWCGVGRALRARLTRRGGEPALVVVKNTFFELREEPLCAPWRSPECGHSLHVERRPMPPQSQVSRICPRDSEFDARQDLLAFGDPGKSPNLKQLGGSQHWAASPLGCRHKVDEPSRAHQSFEECEALGVPA